MCDPQFQAVLTVIMFANAPSKRQIFLETSFFPLCQVQYTYTHIVSSDSPSPLSDNSFYSIPIQDLTLPCTERLTTTGRMKRNTCAKNNY